MILKIVAITTILVIIISFMLPCKYTAFATLMPPQEKSKNALEGVLSEVGMAGLSLNNAGSSSEIMVEILHSRSVGERVLNKYFHCKSDSLPLDQILKFPSVDMGLIRMRRKVHFSTSKHGIITVAVELGDAQLAADVANAYVEALDAVNQEKSVSRAKNSRIYIESQLQETENKLVEVTRRLAGFQRQYKAISLDEQMTAAIQQAGELKGQIIAKQVQLGVMQQNMKGENPLVVRGQMEINELQRRYRELQIGNGKESDEFYVPFSEVPEIGLQLSELTREAKVQETVWELLNQQYYQAKIQEAQDTPTVQVLDRAVPPVLKSFPRRKLLVIIFGLLSLIVGILWAFVKEYLARPEIRPGDKKQVDEIVSEIRWDINRIIKRFSR